MRGPKRSSGRKFRVSQVLPIWTTAHSDTVNLACQYLLLRFGITDVPSYFRVLRIPIAISVVVGATVGAFGYGIKGFFLGGLLGLVAPAALLWLGVLLIGIAIYLVVYMVCMAAAVTVIWWFLSGLLGA